MAVAGGVEALFATDTLELLLVVVGVVWFVPSTKLLSSCFLISELGGVPAGFGATSTPLDVGFGLGLTAGTASFSFSGVFRPDGCVGAPVLGTPGIFS